MLGCPSTKVSPLPLEFPVSALRLVVDDRPVGGVVLEASASLSHLALWGVVEEDADEHR